ncbi:alpha/beta hydrolase [Candidatus Kinetoplastidibacterium crithidiae]|uniref:Phospholipase/carboxylesterase n=1 Tax=Candidatus Kinetoplastidibacterium crithidiae TCC036E TaxID=1208918 RepID=M1LUW7_9PROT|nr:phospholipase/carboxylesterase [Candidatus Kinetoplastibacterium crithidii]AFZ82890.1 phospholipase/carboxylesterase [Candidatus Kinetoplastibacterium crithidii (ex Angomonas deanei ATCC 30255)]AGF47891.1 phospholipase/carboxylesterase [Candidatus Kinetoplastibacterium crithidii TCC036E]
MNINTVDITTHENPTHTIIWLHGLGADSTDSFQLLNYLNITELKLRFVCPDAKKRIITINNNSIMRAWYDIKSNDLSENIDISGIQDSANIIRHLIKKEISQGIRSENIILGGFSQGSVISLYTAMNLSVKIAGVVCLSGYLPDIKNEITNIFNANKNTPFFIAHGLFDEIIPINKFYTCISELKKNGYYLITKKEYTHGHNVNEEELQDIRSFITNIVNNNLLF